jgi:hypothetical protein
LTKKEPGISSFNPTTDSAISVLHAAIEAIEKNTALHEEKNFDQRTDAIDFIGFHIIGRIEGLLEKAAGPDELILLKYRAEKMKADLEETDARLFRKLRAKIRAGNFSGKKFRKLVSECCELNPERGQQNEPGFDNLDVFVNGLLSVGAMPEQTKDLEPEMVYYQKTPARIFFELADKGYFGREDVFFDLGSGPGQAAILVNLLTGIPVKGVEFEPAFCACARDCAAALNLSNAVFINADARQTDYSEASVFFMYTPFTGAIMTGVLARLKEESLQRKIRIITYGPCTIEVARQNWLNVTAPHDGNIYKPAIFSSF